MTRVKISIHAPRAGCDHRSQRPKGRWIYFNPRTPCGVRPSQRTTAGRTQYFNPRTPCGVRLVKRRENAVFDYFNPRTPCGVRPTMTIIVDSREHISIHAPRAGCDGFDEHSPSKWSKFQSTHPVRGATNFYVFRCASALRISIHAPRAGCDGTLPSYCIIRFLFQSTHPVRGATVVLLIYSTCVIFQSTHPVRGATIGDVSQNTWTYISIHAPRAGCDRTRRFLRRVESDFNPRTPCGVRRAFSLVWYRGYLISIHAPRAGCDGCFIVSGVHMENFNPRTPCGVRPSKLHPRVCLLDFNPRTPCGVRRKHLQTGTPGHLNFNPRTPCGVRPGHRAVRE